MNEYSSRKLLVSGSSGKGKRKARERCEIERAKGTKEKGGEKKGNK